MSLDGGPPIHAGRKRQLSYVDTASQLFERLGGWSFDHRWTVFSLCLVAIAICVFFASRTHFDNSFEVYFNQGDPTYKEYLEFRDEFGSDEIAYIVYEAPGHPHGPWNLEVMRKIEKLTAALEEEVPFVEKVTSLTNVEYLEGVPGGIEIDDLLAEFPETQEALLEVREKILRKYMYVGGLVSRDGRYAAILVEMEKSSIDPMQELKLDPNGGTELDNLYPQVSQKRIDEILSRPEYRGIEFHHVGEVPLSAIYNQIIASENTRLGAISFVVIAGLLFLFFRRPLGVTGPMTVAGLSILVAVGLAGLLQWKLDIMFVMLPTLLIAVGVANSVHIISEFRAYHAELGDRREAARRTLRLVGLPCLLTSLTTATGFGAMSIVPIKAISHFAIYSAVGVLAAFLLSMTLLVVFLSFGRPRLPRQALETEKLRAKGGRLFKESLDAISRFDIRHRKAILAFSAGLFVFSAFGIARLRVDSNFLTEFSDRVPVKQAVLTVDAAMGGTTRLIYLFDTGVPDGIKNPEVLREIERFQAEANKQTDLVKKSYSIVDMLKDINQSFHEEDPAYYRLPETPELVAQYLLIYEMSGGEELETYLSSDYSRASLELRCTTTDSSRVAKMAADLKAYLERHPLQASTVSITGIGALWLKLMDYITASQIRGFLLAFTVIAALMCFIFRSLKIGLLSMLPNLSPVILTLGAMGWIGLPLDYVRLLIATVAIGISVDATIHHMTRYIHEFQQTGSYQRALHASMQDVGRALFITSAALVVGFLVFTLSVMDSLANFGLLLASTISLALVADFFLMPALVMTFEPFGPPRTHPAADSHAE